MNLKSCIYLMSFSKTLFFEIGTSFGIHNYCPESQPVLEKEVSHYKTQIRCTQKTKLAFFNIQSRSREATITSSWCDKVSSLRYILSFSKNLFFI